MKPKMGSFADFKEYTLEVARRERNVRPDEPKTWRETVTKPLEHYSVDDLEDVRQRIKETERWVRQKSEQLPGLGWNHVRERLQNDREAIEAEINRRLPP